MENTQNMVKTTLEEIEKILNTRTVFGEPMTFDGTTIIPLIAVGFGFGAGGGGGRATAQQSAEGNGGGAGAGVGIKPVGIVVIDANGARIEPVVGGIASAMEKWIDKWPQMMDKMGQMWMQKKQGGKGGQWQSQPSGQTGQQQSQQGG